MDCRAFVVGLFGGVLSASLASFGANAQEPSGTPGSAPRTEVRKDAAQGEPEAGPLRRGARRAERRVRRGERRAARVTRRAARRALRAQTAEQLPMSARAAGSVGALALILHSMVAATPAAALEAALNGAGLKPLRNAAPSSPVRERACRSESLLKRSPKRSSSPGIR
jgi:hypothetical protein